MTISSKAASLIRNTATVILPLSIRMHIRKIQRQFKLQSSPVGSVNFGGLRRLTPISPIFGIDRDLINIDRYYIEKFLSLHTADIKGRVLEMGEPLYTKKFGAEKVTRSDVLNYVEGNPKANIVADLTKAENIADNTYDCIIITQTLQMIYDVQAAVETLHRILKPGGVVLVTSHGITKVARREGIDSWGEYWHFTYQSKKHLFEQFFHSKSIHISTYGNILTTIASLHGLAANELDQNELDYCDPDYEALVTVRATK
ncbi:MAG: methyltransferase [Cycloclasticus sp.]|nr:methyltransferase [Cycloclasticus sp.]MBG96854.1 methyltransferase [Cycloclasticus sp.]HAI97447.1 methyltransferase [Methylococcaceae bacterium]